VASFGLGEIADRRHWYLRYFCLCWSSLLLDLQMRQMTVSMRGLSWLLKTSWGPRLAGSMMRAPKSTGASLTKAALSKAAPSQMKSVPKAGAASRASVTPKAGAPAKAAMLKSAATLAVPRAGVFMISTGVKRASAESLSAPKGKQAKVCVVSFLTSTLIHKAAA
jgi:hypothetical protein